MFTRTETPKTNTYIKTIIPSPPKLFEIKYPFPRLCRHFSEWVPVRRSNTVPTLTRTGGAEKVRGKRPSRDFWYYGNLTIKKILGPTSKSTSRQQRYLSSKSLSCLQRPQSVSDATTSFPSGETRVESKFDPQGGLPLPFSD